ncbi:MAG: hypothetical protein ACFCUE_12000 [Candidatus Bathyarchaeia archaeon]|jgi:hypothetical protein
MSQTGTTPNKQWQNLNVNIHKNAHGVTKLTNEEAPQVRVVFQGELKKRFDAIKRHYCIEGNAEMIRLLVALKYEDLKKEGKI